MFTSSLKSLGLPSNLTKITLSEIPWERKCVAHRVSERESLEEIECRVRVRDKCDGKGIIEWHGNMPERVCVTDNLTQYEKANLRDNVYGRKWVCPTWQSVTGNEADHGRQQPGKVDHSSGPMFPWGQPSPGLRQSGGSQQLGLAQMPKPRSSQSVSSVIKLIFRLKHMQGVCVNGCRC